MTKTIEQQVVAALTAEPPLSVAQLLTLVAALEAGITEADAAAETAQAKFLDPIETPDINAGRAAVEATQFTANRLRTLLPRLETRAREVEADEDRREWETDFKALAGERNALAQELRQTYPAAVAALVNLLARIEANDAALSQLHQSRPNGAKGYLLGAELVARELSEFNRDTPSVTRELRLPSWTKSSKLAWPPPHPSAGFVLSAPPPHDPRYSADWAAAKEAEYAARRAQEGRQIEAERAAQAESRRAYESR